MPHRKHSRGTLRLLARLFRLVRRLLRRGVSPFLILAIVFLALAGFSGLGGFGWLQEGSHDDGGDDGGDEDDD